MKHKGPEDTNLTSVDGSVECLVKQSGQPRSLDQANERAERTDLEPTGSFGHTRSLPACLVSKVVSAICGYEPTDYFAKKSP